MDKLDFIKEDKQLYSPKIEPEVVEVPPMKYLMYDGTGLPEGNPAFQKAFQALYGVAYTIKFMPKKGAVPEGFREFKVPPPEGLWWMKDGKAFDQAKPADWCWTLMIRMPDFVDVALVDKAITELAAKKKDDVYYQVRLDTYKEGKSVQVMHVGAYDAEGPTLEKMEHFTEDHDMHYRGKHHEIYFGDPRRTRPEKLRTILRHPVK